MRIARSAAARPGQLILGSRSFDKDVPARSRFGNTVTRHVYHLATGVAIRDTQTGLRAFTAGMIPDMLKVPGERYEYEINVLMDFAREGIPIVEERIETVYMNDNAGSHFNTVRDSARIYKEILRFSASSFIGFLTDYGMFALLSAVTALLASGASIGAEFFLAYGLIISNIAARLISSIVNYTINRKYVFRSKTGAAGSAAGYFTLAAFILAGNTLVLSTLVGTFGINRLAAKIMTEIMFFAVSWLIQRYVIFYERDSAAYEHGRKRCIAGRREAVR